MTTEGLKVAMLGWEEAREVLAPLYRGRKHWIIVAASEALPLIQAIEERYYAGDRNGDLTIITGSFRGRMYVLAAAKKRWMQGYQVSSLLRQMVHYKTSESELRERDLLITARDGLLQDAFDLAASLFHAPASGDLGLAE